jgi:hypothetical protein
VCDDRSHDFPLLSRSRRDQAAAQHARVGRRGGQVHTGGPFRQPARGGSCESGPMQHGALSGGRGALHSSVRVINQRHADDVLCRSERSRAAWLLALVLGVREQPRAALVEPETSCTKLVHQLPHRGCPALGTAGIPALFRVAGGSILKIPGVWTAWRRPTPGACGNCSAFVVTFPCFPTRRRPWHAKASYHAYLLRCPETDSTLPLQTRHSHRRRRVVLPCSRQSFRIHPSPSSALAILELPELLVLLADACSSAPRLDHRHRRHHHHHHHHCHCHSSPLAASLL